MEGKKIYATLGSKTNFVACNDWEKMTFYVKYFLILVTEKISKFNENINTQVIRSLEKKKKNQHFLNSNYNEAVIQDLIRTENFF